VTQKETSAVTWEDEEEEEEEEEEVPQETSGNATPPKGPLKPKQLKKLKMKEIEEKRNMEIAITKARLAEQANETAAERKAREQRSIEEADYEAAIDAFTPAPAAGAASVSDIESAISNLRLATLSEHEQLGELVASKLIPSVRLCSEPIILLHIIQFLLVSLWVYRTQNMLLNVSRSLSPRYVFRACPY
jgi:translation initiation factor 3 subunit J